MVCCICWTSRLESSFFYLHSMIPFFFSGFAFILIYLWRSPPSSSLTFTVLNIFDPISEVPTANTVLPSSLVLLLTLMWLGGMRGDRIAAQTYAVNA